MRVLVACEFSGVVSSAFRRHGHAAWSCDLLPTEGDPKWHLQADVRVVISMGWDMLIAHPPCTYLTNAGVRWLHSHVESRNGKQPNRFGHKRWFDLVEAAALFNVLKRADVPRIAIENPVPHRYARELIGDYNQMIHPWQFGHGETKATCLWLKGLPKLEPTCQVEGRHPTVHLMSPREDRAKERSRTYMGIAEAMARQWGDILCLA
jgi:hypothetical protein